LSLSLLYPIQTSKKCQNFTRKKGALRAIQIRDRSISFFNRYLYKYRTILLGISYHCKLRFRISSNLPKVKYRLIMSVGLSIYRLVSSSNGLNIIFVVRLRHLIKISNVLCSMIKFISQCYTLLCINDVRQFLYKLKYFYTLTLSETKNRNTE